MRGLKKPTPLFNCDDCAVFLRDLKAASNHCDQPHALKPTTAPNSLQENPWTQTNSSNSLANPQSNSPYICHKAFELQQAFLSFLVS